MKYIEYAINICGEQSRNYIENFYNIKLATFEIAKLENNTTLCQVELFRQFWKEELIRNLDAAVWCYTWNTNMSLKEKDRHKKCDNAALEFNKKVKND